MVNTTDDKIVPTKDVSHVSGTFFQTYHLTQQVMTRYETPVYCI